MAANVAALLAKIEEVCPLPATAHRVIALSSKPDAEIDEVAAALEADPALAAEVLRIANSAAFGRARTVNNLKQGVMVIGLLELRDMATAMAMIAAFRSDSELALQLHDRSVLAGAVARRLARELPGADPGAAFVAGLLAEIGAMACLAVDAKNYLSLYISAAGNENERLQRELERYGANSREIGARLLGRNGVPDEIADAVGAVGAAPDSPILIRLTLFSRVAAPFLLDIGRRGSLPDLTEGLREIAMYASLSLPGPRLVAACAEASGQAEQTLRHSR